MRSASTTIDPPAPPAGGPPTGRPGRLLAGLSCAVLAVAGCSSGSSRPAVSPSPGTAAVSTTSQQIVADVGGSLSNGPIRLAVPAGSLAHTATVSLTSRAAAPPAAGDTILQPVGSPFSVAITGATPVGPLVLTLPVAAADAGASLVLVQTGSSAPTAVAGQYAPSGGVWTGSISAAGTYQLVAVQAPAVRSRVAATVNALLPGLDTAGAPACTTLAAKRANNALTIAAGIQGPVWPCVSTNKLHGISVELQNQSGLPWLISSTIGGPAKVLAPTPSPVRSVAGLVLAAALQYQQRGLMAPGGTLYWGLTPATAPVAMSATAMDGVWLGAAMSAGVLRVVDESRAGGPVGLPAVRAQLATLSGTGPSASCLAASGVVAADGVTLDPATLARVAPAALACAGTVATEAGAGEADLDRAIAAAAAADPQALAAAIDPRAALVTATASTSWSIRTFSADPCRSAGGLEATDCTTVAAADVDGDGSPDLIGVVRPAGTAPTVGIRVLTAKGPLVTVRRTVTDWPTTVPLWVGAADIDGGRGRDLVIGDSSTAGGQSFRVLAIRGTRLADLVAPGRGGVAWPTSAGGTLTGYARGGTDRFSTRPLLVVSVLTPDPGGATYTDTATRYEFGADRWYQFLTPTTTTVSAATARDTAGWHLAGLPQTVG